MPKPLNTVLDAIAKEKPPEVILIGGDNDYLAERAFHDIRDAIIAKMHVNVESFEPGTDLAAVIDSYRTMSLFGGSRLLVLPEVNAFVSAKELSGLYEKAVADWTSAKTDRKRASSAAKLLHVLGLVGADLDMKDAAIADALGVDSNGALLEMLGFARATGKKATRGETDAALLTEAITCGGAAGTILLLRTGELPRDSATIDLIERRGVVVMMNLTREGFVSALDGAITEIAADAKVRFEPAAVVRLRQRLGIERMLSDKFSRDIPDLRSALSEAERLVTLAGAGGRVAPDMVDREIAAVEGGARYELASLFTEGKYVEAVAKLRELVAQGRREDPKTATEYQYGKYLFPLADELRQMIAIRGFARTNRIDLQKSIPYNRFKDTLADRLGDYLKNAGLVRQRPHPFPLHKKWEAARSRNDADLFRALAEIAEMDVKRKSGGVPMEIALETFLLSRGSQDRHEVKT
jgi:DNA polymerase III delta subunit